MVWVMVHMIEEYSQVNIIISRRGMKINESNAMIIQASFEPMMDLSISYQDQVLSRFSEPISQILKSLHKYHPHAWL